MILLDETRDSREEIRSPSASVRISIVSTAICSGYIASERLAPWVKRCVVRAASDRVRMEIQHIVASYIQQAGAEMPSPCNVDVQSALLRRVPIERISENPNTLERVALVLYFHSGFSAQDCVLLRNCPRSLIERACARAQRRIFEEESAAAVGQKDIDGRGLSERTA